MNMISASKSCQILVADKLLTLYQRYRHLARKNKPFLRYSELSRMGEGREEWALGFHEAFLGDSGRLGLNGRVPPDSSPLRTVIFLHNPGVDEIE
ncbi:hypothetical protein PspLS_11076 [Pyricularia sp. CBS 133598]|nr:hypothetical protein PspLS_11076 [Pyricularia sp. CBS 133598]